MTAPPDDPAGAAAPSFAAGQVVTVFRSLLRADAGAEYVETAEQMLRLAHVVPGFVDFKTFTADDGERVSLVTFADRAAHTAWATDVEHRAAQQAGRERFYDAYTIQVADCTSARGFSRPGT